MDRYVKSLIWLASFSILGYGLLIATSPSEQKIEQLRKTFPPISQVERERTKKLLETIEAAANIKKN